MTVVFQNLTATCKLQLMDLEVKMPQNRHKRGI